MNNSESKIEFGDRIKFDNLRTGLLIQDGNTVYKVSEVRRNLVSVILEFPSPPRTTVREFRREEIEFRFKHITRGAYDQYTEWCDEMAALRGARG